MNKREKSLGRLLDKYREGIMRIVFLIAACASIASVILICVFLFANSIPALSEIGLFKFLTGTKWKPGSNIYGRRSADHRGSHRAVDRDFSGAFLPQAAG